MNRLSISYAIREMQIKTGKHHIPIRMARIQNTENIKCWWECGATGLLIHCWWEWKMVQSSWKVILMVTYKYLYNFIHSCQNLKASKISFSRWGGTQAVEYLDNEILFSAKSKWIIKPEKYMEKSVFLPGEFHRQRSLVGYSPWGHKESNTTEWLTRSLSKIHGENLNAYY